MICKKCSNEIQESWIACPYCGKVLKKKKPAQKRGNKQGSVYKRGDTWTARVTLETYTKDGKVYQKRASKGGFATRTEAMAYLGKLTEGDVDRTPTLQRYWETFRDGHMQALSESKRSAYRTAWKRLEPIAMRQIGKLTVSELQTLINDECETYYPARDVRVLLSHLYKLAAVEGKVNAHLPELLTIPRLEEVPRDPFTPEEQADLWKAYEEGCAEAAYPLILIYTGMMPGELQRLTTEMVDLPHKAIVGVGLKTKARKTQSVLLPSAVLPLLQALMEGKAPKDRLVPLDKKRFYAAYYKALEQAGVRPLTPYSCRHTTATALAITENIAPQTVRRVMRWSNSRMLDRYAHPSDADARAAVEAL